MKTLIVNILFFVVVIFQIFSCKPITNIQTKEIIGCNKSEAEKICDAKMIVLKYNIERYNREIDDSSDVLNYIVKYTNKTPNILGGGAEIKVNKKTCVIVWGGRYQ